MRRILLIAFLLISTTVHAQSTTLRWEKNVRDFWENHVDAIPDAFWEAQMDAYVESGVVISSGMVYQLVLPVMETWPAGLSWFVFGDGILAVSSDSLAIRGVTLYGYTVTKTDTICVNPTVAQYVVLSWNKKTRKKTRRIPPLALGKRDAFFAALYSKQAWSKAVTRLRKVKEKQQSLNERGIR